MAWVERDFKDHLASTPATGDLPLDQVAPSSAKPGPFFFPNIQFKPTLCEFEVVLPCPEQILIF